MVPLKRLALLAIAVLALSGCTPGEDSPRDSEASPGASATPTESAEGKDDEPEPDGDGEDPAGLTLPDSCAELVPIEWVRTNFGASFEEIPVPASGGGPVAADFAARGGLNCLWGIPQSDAGVRLHVAERATASDEEQVEAWRSAGFQECLAFLDACWFEPTDSMLGDYVTVYTLVEGYELRADGFGQQPDPYQGLIRQATDSMGYL